MSEQTPTDFAIEAIRRSDLMREREWIKTNPEGR